MKPRLIPPDPTEAEIQHAAYFLWEAEGCPVGRDVEIWFEAKERLKHRAAPRERTSVHAGTSKTRVTATPAKGLRPAVS